MLDVVVRLAIAADVVVKLEPPPEAVAAFDSLDLTTAWYRFDVANPMSNALIRSAREMNCATVCVNMTPSL